MCAVSAISDYYRGALTGWPGTTIPPVKEWDQDTKDMMKKVVELLEKIDAKLGDRDCHDESKAEFMKAIGAVEDNPGLVGAREIGAASVLSTQKVKISGDNWIYNKDGAIIGGPGGGGYYD